MLGALKKMCCWFRENLDAIRRQDITEAG